MVFLDIVFAQTLSFDRLDNAFFPGFCLFFGFIYVANRSCRISLVYRVSSGVWLSSIVLRKRERELCTAFLVIHLWFRHFDWETFDVIEFYFVFGADGIFFSTLILWGYTCVSINVLLCRSSTTSDVHFVRISRSINLITRNCWVDSHSTKPEKKNSKTKQPFNKYPNPNRLSKHNFFIGLYSHRWSVVKVFCCCLYSRAENAVHGINISKESHF